MDTKELSIIIRNLTDTASVPLATGRRVLQPRIVDWRRCRLHSIQTVITLRIAIYEYQIFRDALIDTNPL